MNLDAPKVRDDLVEALALDPAGPCDHPSLRHKCLDEASPRWSWTGLLVLLGSPPEVRQSDDKGFCKYHEARAARMVRDAHDRFGLTELCSRFHDPRCEDEDITALRDLHAAMDRAVLDAYGWGDLAVTHAFVDDHAGEEDDEGAGRRQRSVRWRWPDTVRDEVLARLIALNASRAAAEATAREAAGEGKAKRGRKKG